MKAKEALWKIKQAYNQWTVPDDWDEFWQDVLAVLREFEKKIRDEYGNSPITKE